MFCLYIAPKNNTSPLTRHASNSVAFRQIKFIAILQCTSIVLIIRVILFVLVLIQQLQDRVASTHNVQNRVIKQLRWLVQQRIAGFLAMPILFVLMLVSVILITLFLINIVVINLLLHRLLFQYGFG